MIHSISPETLHISGYGKRLIRYKGMLRVDWPEQDETVSITISPAHLRYVILSGEHTVTTGALGILLENGIDLTFLDSFGNPSGYLFPSHKGNMISVWEKQSELHAREVAAIARTILFGSAMSKVSVLKDIERNRNHDLNGFIDQMMTISRNIKKADNRNELTNCGAHGN